jgi:DNA-binding LacI/PurR family transcriptional regulator
MNDGIQPTIDDVAAAAGLSRSTVSRVINADPRVSDQARRAITRAMDDLGYEPDAAAQTLARRRPRAPGVS